ncbi:asparagine synthase (glutamine-hydrolyzing) [Jeongeupia wiesaeckerbachi]|uniref:asparagine synthase (glutamine-hydrolyzing) n=1 Tax=Jeongeupia wiesaeckerbachi TaxID=3051218 RepID=UPI003D80225D
MCGIAGFFLPDTLPRTAIDAAIDALRRRGPDAAHVIGWRRDGSRSDGDAEYGLLHRRLSIRDPRPEADQPMRNDAGDIWICYNGEVYGWEDDAAALARDGVVFNTRSDTEFILRGYERWGFEALLPKLRGMFALSIVDWRTRTVWLARDRLGLKPLIYHHGDDGRFAFGSLVRAVLPLVPAAARQLDADGLAAYLAHRYIPAPRTIFGGLRRLENGHLLRYDMDGGKLENRAYWQPEAGAGEPLALLDEAIGLRTVADRPVGVFLSSGVDSVVIASRLAAQGHKDLSTYTAAFAGSTLDESDAAAGIAKHLGLRHERIEVPNTIAADFDEIVATLDEPFADPSALPMWYLSRATSEQVKVVLCGDGGDELFAGYKRYRQHLRSSWRGGFRLPLPYKPDVLGRNKLAQEAGLAWGDAYSLRFSGFSPQQRAALMPTLPARPHYWRDGVPAASPVESLLNRDLANYLPEYILRKADLVTMAHGLEGRAPLLDHLFVASVLAQPADRRFTDPAKQLLAPAIAGLPDALNPFLQKKRGFNPPLTHWLQTDLADRYAGLGARLTANSDGLLAASAVDTLVAAYRGGNTRYAEQVLQLLMLDASLAQLKQLNTELR